MAIALSGNGRRLLPLVLVRSPLHAAVTTTLQRDKRYTLRKPEVFWGQDREARIKSSRREGGSDESARERGSARERERERRIRSGIAPQENEGTEDAAVCPVGCLVHVLRSAVREAQTREGAGQEAEFRWMSECERDFFPFKGGKKSQSAPIGNLPPLSRHNEQEGTAVRGRS